LTPTGQSWGFWHRKKICNKRALKGILEQKIKKIAAPTKIQIQKFDRKGGQWAKNWEVGGGLAFFKAKLQEEGVVKKGTGIPRGSGDLGGHVRKGTTSISQVLLSSNRFSYQC
jgi:hypothetical protein